MNRSSGGDLIFGSIFQLQPGRAAQRTRRRWPAICLLAVLLAACSEPAGDFYPGYAEAEYVRLSSPIGGSLAKLHVKQGDRIEQGAPVFVLEQESERAARQEADSRVQRAQAQLANLQKGRRPDEIAAAQAQLMQAEAALKLSEANLKREQQLVAQRFVSPARLDEARAAFERDRAQVSQLQAQLRTAKLGARPDEIEAARQELAAAQAQQAQAQWRLGQKSQPSPASAEVIDVLYREGEWVAPGSPVVSLLPAQNIKARFFVSEAVLGQLRLGQQVRLRCDGCAEEVQAAITFIAPGPEFTAPMIYSRENRASLVFMVEARPVSQQAQRLHPGQPLEVRLVQPKAAP